MARSSRPVRGCAARTSLAQQSETVHGGARKARPSRCLSGTRCKNVDDPRCSLYSRQEILQMCRARGLGGPLTKISKVKLLTCIDEADDKATVKELSNICRTLGVRGKMRTESKKALLERMRSAQWCRGRDELGTRQRAEGSIHSSTVVIAEDRKDHIDPPSSPAVDPMESDVEAPKTDGGGADDPVLLQRHACQCSEDTLRASTKGTSIMNQGDLGLMGNACLQDWGEPPVWHGKGMRSSSQKPGRSIELAAPLSEEKVWNPTEANDEYLAADDDDLFGEEKKWALDLPEVVSPIPLESSGSLVCTPHPPMDMHIRSEEVARRIEDICEFLISCIEDNQLPSLPCGVNSAPFSMQTDKALLRFSRMMMTIDIVHDHLTEDKDSRITQRELFYVLKSRDSAVKAPQMMQLIQDVSQLLQVPRFALGIDCRSKGLVHGGLLVEGPMGSMDCTSRKRGCPISGSVPEILDSSFHLCDVASILVVEKESVFQRLVSEAPKHPILSKCIIVTGCGYPDVGTRAFLHRLWQEHDGFPVLGFVDWNPHGAHILCQYRYGSQRSLESRAFCIPDIAWLGLRSGTLERLVQDSQAGPCLADLSHRDKVLAKSMRSKLQEYNNTAWMREIECMEYGLKVDIESLYGMLNDQTLCDLLGGMIEREEWI
jgi:meiotic recombination protein SPO11